MVIKSKSPIKVAIVGYRDDATAGGSLRVGQAIANSLDPARVEAHLVFAYGGPGPVSVSTLLPCHYLDAPGPRNFKAWRRARNVFRKINPDIVHFMDNIGWLQLALLGTAEQKIVHVHGPFLSVDCSLKTRLIWRLMKRLTQHHVCISEGAKSSLVQLGFSQPEKSSVVYNSVDCAAFKKLPGKKTARERLGLPLDARLLGMVCRLVPNKSGADFISLIQQLPIHWHGVICGDGPQRPELESQCRRMGVDGRIHFLETQGDVLPVYAALDAYAFLTRYESFGMTLAESMAAGVPVFGFAGAGGYREPSYHLIAPEVAALIEYERPYDSAEPASPEALAELAALIMDYGKHADSYHPMIEAARSWVNCCFDVPLQAEAMTRVYEYVTGPGGSISPQLTRLYETARAAGLSSLDKSAALRQVTEVA